MMAATRSREECRASDKTPKLPVRRTRKVFRETSSTAEPTLRSAARFFSVAISKWAGAGIGLDYPKFAELVWGNAGVLCEWGVLDIDAWGMKRRAAEFMQ